MDDTQLQSAVDASLGRLAAQRLDAEIIDGPVVLGFDPATGPDRTVELDVISDGLFPPTPAERLDILATFVKRERGIRAALLPRHSDEREAWQKKVAAADEALHHIEQLRKEIG
jgi:hypothetical protein